MGKLKKGSLQRRRAVAAISVCIFLSGCGSHNYAPQRVHEAEPKPVPSQNKSAIQDDAVLPPKQADVSMSQPQQEMQMAPPVEMTEFVCYFQPGRSQFESSFILNLGLRNVSNKVVSAVKGKFIAMNAFGDRLVNFRIEAYASAKPGESFAAGGPFDYNPFISDDVRLSETPKAQVRGDFELIQVNFDDGSSWP